MYHTLMIMGNYNLHQKKDVLFVIKKNGMMKVKLNPKIF